VPKVIGLRKKSVVICALTVVAVERNYIYSETQRERRQSGRSTSRWGNKLNIGAEVGRCGSVKRGSS
jgi:hypothetical protein